MTERGEAEVSREELLEQLAKLRGRLERLARETAGLEETEEALRISEEVFRQIFEEGPIGMHLVTPTFHILRANDALCRMLGYDAEELIGRPLATILHPDDVDKGLELAVEMRSGKLAGYQIERRYLRKDKATVWAKLSASVIRDRSGESLYGIGVVENITERRRAEEERSRLEAQLHQSQKMEAIGRLAGGVAHDFNNLLTVILGNASLLKRSIPGQDETAVRRLGEILEAGERASSLIRQMLTFSRKSIRQPEILDPNAVVRELEPMLRRLIGEHVELVVTLGENACHVEVDRSQLEQVILNLSLNARDAMPSGGELRIVTSLRRTGGSNHFVVEFKDTGRGMSDATIARAYEPFFTTKPPGQGTGLGLATVYAIVTEAGGAIEVDSTVGEGTTVTVSLPEKDAPVTAKHTDGGPTELSGSELVLVREDDEQVRRVTCQVLRSRGYDVLEATSAVHAESLLRESPRPIALLVTDVVMPDANGLELARRLTRLDEKIRVLFISGYTSQFVDPPGGPPNGLSFLQKPFSPEALARRVREILDRPTV